MHTVLVYRADNGQQVQHLSRAFPTLEQARAYALAANCKPFTPFYSVAR